MSETTNTHILLGNVHMIRRHFLLGMVATLLAVAAKAEARTGRIEKLINLTGTGKGKARYRIDPGNKRSLSVEVQQLKSLAGQTLSVNVLMGGSQLTVASMLISSLGTGKIELQTEQGQSVPGIQPGAIVAVMLGANTILSGTF